MLDEADRLAKAGKAVYVIFATKDQGEVFRTPWRDENGIKFETFDSLRNFNPRTFQLQGSKNCEVLIDHHAIEQHFGKLIAEMHRWDYQ